MRAPARFPLSALGLLAASGCGGERPGAISPSDVSDPFARGDAAVIDAGLGPRPASAYPAYDLTLTLPYMAEARTFEVSVEPRATRLDVHFNVDTTGSFNGEIANLKASLGNFVIPRLRERSPDLAMGVSRFADFPAAPFGRVTDRPYDLLSPMTTDYSRVLNAVASLDQPLQNGGDLPEAWAESLFQIATGEGLRGAAGFAIAPFLAAPGTPANAAPGGVGFRAGAARVVVNVTDAPTHEPASYGDLVPGTHTVSEALAALRAVNVRLIGIASGEGSRAQMERLAFGTGAYVPASVGRCATGVLGAARPASGDRCPLVFDIAADGAGIGVAVVDAIVSFLDALAFQTVTASAVSDPGGFVQAIHAIDATAPAGTPLPEREDRAPAGTPDGLDDTFIDVQTRTRLTFRVVARNTQRPEEEFPQLYFTRIQLVGDGVVVGERVVRVIVPEGPKPDAGPDGARPVDASLVEAGIDGAAGS